MPTFWKKSEVNDPRAKWGCYGDLRSKIGWNFRQLPGQTNKWFMSFIAFDGHGYNSFVAESTNLVQWIHPRLAMGFGPPGEFYFGVGRGGAHIMAAFSRDLVHWTADAEPLYKAGGNPSGLDRQYAHKVSLVYNPRNDTFYLYYCACGNKGRGIGLITSKLL